MLESVYFQGWACWLTFEINMPVGMGFLGYCWGIAGVGSLTFQIIDRNL
jgi:hypothetical protein